MGRVFVIRCVPDLFTDERLNIGVCGIDANGRRKVKVITEPGRLTCLYGESSINVLMLAQAGMHAAEIGAPPPSSQIIFDTPMPYYRGTVDEIVESTFADQVTVALPNKPTANNPSMSDDEALRRVIDQIKQRIGLNLEILAATPQVLIQTDKGPRTMVVPLQPRNGVGTVRSAFYSATTLKTHLMDSVLDLECAARYRSRKHQGLFILRPSKGTKEAMAAIDNAIDDVAFRCPKTMYLGVSDDAKELAAEAAEWAAKAV